LRLSVRLGLERRLCFFFRSLAVQPRNCCRQGCPPWAMLSPSPQIGDPVCESHSRCSCEQNLQIPDKPRCSWELLSKLQAYNENSKGGLPSHSWYVQLARPKTRKPLRSVETATRLFPFLYLRQRSMKVQGPKTGQRRLLQNQALLRSGMT